MAATSVYHAGPSFFLPYGGALPPACAPSFVSFSLSIVSLQVLVGEGKGLLVQQAWSWMIVSQFEGKTLACTCLMRGNHVAVLVRGAVLPATPAVCHSGNATIVSLQEGIVRKILAGGAGHAATSPPARSG